MEGKKFYLYICVLGIIIVYIFYQNESGEINLWKQILSRFAALMQ